MHRSTEVPLTGAQKGLLFFDCLPFLFMLALLIFTVTLLDTITGASSPWVLPLFLGFTTLYAGWVAFQRLHDLFSGYATVQDDRLVRMWTSRRGQANRYPYGEFEQLGTLRLQPRAYAHGSNGVRYRVTYSPASKVVWSLEQV